MIAEYEEKMQPARLSFAHRIGLLRPSRLFFQRFCAWGVGMTAPVEDWITRAGERCIELEQATVGRALLAHARHEAGHHLMMLADLHALGGSPATEWPASVQAYRRLHEAVIASEAPWAQLAIEYEIENVSVVHGPRLLAQAPVRLSFVEEHVALDAAHTEFNRRHLSAFLAANPSELNEMTWAGMLALHHYAGFLEDCSVT